MHGTFAFLQLSLVLCAKTECGYKQCPQTREGALNVHLIPHSHMDAGWVKTFDEYYYGTKTSISSANVQLIYHSVISELLYDKKRKFTFSETSYFWRWWKEQRPITRSTFRSLVQEGRVEFAGGGWVQNDEATSDYLQIIDQYTWGLRKLNDTLGLCGKPKAAWQIDTYGHTREQASLLAQMGFDGLFIGRVDHKEKESMIEEDRMEFIWRGSDVLGKMSDIMTHTLFNLYNPPEGFCFDILCNDEPIVDDPDSKSYNADKRVNDFIVQIERQAKYYDHDNILVTAGGDFTYQSAANWFINMDKLINHVNTHPVNLSDVNIFYSSPSCYLKAIYLHGRRDKAVFTERSDHMPYGSDSSTYWSGYYSSRPSFKYFIRKAHVFLQSGDIHIVMPIIIISGREASNSPCPYGDSYELHLLRHAVNLVVHHDAITGTSQQHVTNDFLRILSEAVDACTNKVSYLLSNLTPTWGAGRRSKNSQHFTVCHQLNISQCRFTETQESMVLLIYNPLSVKVYHHLCFPVKALHFTIRDFNDEDIEYQLVPLPAAVLSLTGRTSSAIQELCFEAENIPPLGYTSYYVTLVRDQLEENEYAKKSAKGHAEAEQEVATSISNEYLKISIKQSTGLLSSIQHVDGVSIAVSQNFHYYGQGKSSQQSGAYSFRPETQRPVPVTDKATYHVVRGTLIKEIRQRFNDWVSQVIRLYRGEEFIELEWIIGPVPVGTDLGKEVVMLFSTNISNSGEFFTDSNSRQMMKRTCWNETTSQQQKKSISSCYYPVTSRICIRCANSSIEMCVLNDRAQGGTSYNDGEIELMIHRRLLTDDGFGLEESLNEESYGTGLVVRGKHRILFGNFRQELEELSFSERVSQAARRWRYEPWLFFAPGEKISRRKWQNVRNKRYSLLRMRGLPRHIHILTLEPWKSGSVLLRLENVLEESRDHLSSENPEGTTRASHITVDLRKLFAVPIKFARETTLAANQWLDDARQMDWSTRYVYSGSDDGVTQEGVTEDYDNKQTHQTDAGSASEEETQRRRFQKYTKPKRTVRRHRHKRAIVNKDATKTINVTSRTGLLSRTKSESNDSFSDAKSYSNDTKINKNKAKSQKDRMHYSNYKKKIPYENYSSEESLSLRKISKVIEDAKTEKAITSDDDESDDITKSIYEMYYKVKPKKNAFKPFLRNPHLNHHTKNSRGSYPRKNVNLRTANRDAPKRPIGRLTDKRRNVKTDDYSNESDESSEYTKVDEHRVYSSQEDSSEDIQTNEEYWRTQKNRRKRTLQREESESEGKQDYLITLRPTQIRTFVVWFDNIKN